MNISKAIAEINASYESTLISHIASANASSIQDIGLTEPFFGIEWGVSEWNSQRQKWRWLGPFGQSHLFLNLPTTTDHLIRFYIHTAASGKILEALTVLVNGTRCTHQGSDWGADGVASHWCIVERDLVAKRQGIAKITLSVRSAGERPQVSGVDNEPGHPTHARTIAFSRITCEPSRTFAHKLLQTLNSF